MNGFQAMEAVGPGGGGGENVHVHTHTYTRQQVFFFAVCIESFAEILFGLPALLRQGGRVGVKDFTWVCLLAVYKTPKR